MFNIKVNVVKAVEDFWGKYKTASGGLRGIFDIREWSNSTDTLYDVLAVDNEIYILQEYMSPGVILKRLTPNKTYIYNLSAIPRVLFASAMSNYGMLDKLYDNMLLMGPMLLDLDNKVMSMFIKPPMIKNYNLRSRSYIPFRVWSRKLTDNSWIYSQNGINNGYKVRFYLFQITNPINCLKCKYINNILKGIKCKEVEDKFISMYFANEFNVYGDTSNVKDFSTTYGMSDNMVDIKPSYSSKECSKYISKMIKDKPSSILSDSNTKIYKNVFKYCLPCLLSSISSIVELKIEHENIKKDLSVISNVKDINIKKKDLNNFFKLFVEFIGVLKNELNNDEVYEFINNIFKKDFFSTVFINIFYSNIVNKYIKEKTQPYAYVGKIPNDYIKNIINDIQQGNKDNAFFMGEKILSKTKNFSEDISYVLAGPIGCLKKIKFNDFSQNIDQIVKTEILNDNYIYVWAWEDINKNLATMYTKAQLFKPIYRYRIFLLDIKNKKTTMIHEIQIPEKWVPLDNGSKIIATNINQNYVVFKDYYISKYDENNPKNIEIDYVEIKKKLHNIDFIKHTKATFINSNLNNVNWWMGSKTSNGVLPGFPDKLKKRLSIDNSKLQIKGFLK